MWVRLVATGLIVAAVCGCNPFEGTVFELRAPDKTMEQSDPNTARAVGQDDHGMGEESPIVPNETSLD